MARIPEDTVEQVRQSVDIVEVVADYVALTRRGKNHLGLCPFHEDRRPSFNVSQDKQIYKCFSCGAGGNVFTFLMELEKISFVEAIKQLAERAGIVLPEDRERSDDGQQVFDQLYAANELARKYYHHLLTSDPAGEGARRYLQSREISDKSIASFQLGVAPDAWEGLLQVAGRRGIRPDVLEQAGLVLSRREGSGHYDRFRNRVMYPIHSHTGRTVAFGARSLDPDERAKYLNSPDSPVYHKGRILYGLWGARDALRKAGTAVLVEGYMDVIALAQRGIQNTIATSGTALTPEQARLLRRYADRAVLVFDGDAPGAAAAVRGLASLFEAEVETRVVSLTDGHDPDSYVQKHGPDAFLVLAEKAEPAIDYLVRDIGRKEDLSTADGKVRAARQLAEYLSRVADEARRRLMAEECAQKVGVDPATFFQILGQVRRPKTDTRTPDAPVTTEAFDPRPRSERELLILMMSNDQVADYVVQQVGTDEFTNSYYRRISSLIAQGRQQGQPVTAAPLVDRCGDPGLAQIISTLSMEIGISDPDRPQPPVQDYIIGFRLRKLDAEIDGLEASLRPPVADADIRVLMERHKALTEQKKALLDSRSQLYKRPSAGQTP